MNHYLDAFEAFSKERSGDAVHPLREGGLSRFRELGFPTTKLEEWRFTNVAPIAKSELALGHPSTNGVTADDVERLGFGGLVFIDGHYRADLSDAPTGVSLATVRDQIELAGNADASAFAELNTAFLEDGAYIEIDGELDDPIHVLFLGTDGKVCHPRNMYRIRRNARAHIVETYASLGASEHWTNAVHLIQVEENAELHHTRLQLENDSAFHTSSLWASQARDSRYTSNVVTLGGRLVRNDLTVSLRAENCLSTLNGLFLAGGTQHMDTHTWMEHREPNCESHELYKGILDDRASGVFSGYIHVYEDAQKTDAYQSSKNLLLSDKAKLESQPQLEIYADDVKCSHGSTIGQLDKEALFYMQSRGIPAPRARTMLIRAFAGDVTDRLTIDAVRDRVDKLITERLPG